MNLPKTLATAAVIVSLSAPVTFSDMKVSAAAGSPAVTESTQPEKKDLKQKREEFERNPVNALESKKARIQSLVKDGKLTKEKADELTARIDARIKEIQIFEKLPLQEKKATLLKDCRTALDKQVQEGKLAKDKADTIFKKYSEKINQWDGTGYPKFHSKRLVGRPHKPDAENRQH